jgi:hypothetical protein
MALVVARKLCWHKSMHVEDKEEPEGSTPVVAIPPQAVVVLPGQDTMTTVIQPRIKQTRNRVGNGHKKQMIRKLIDSERDYFRREFLSKNGQITEDFCVAMKRNVSPDVAIFQVTGFISYLHRDVALGRTQVRDLMAYCEWMRTKYEDLWAQYNKPIFVQTRQQNAQNRATGRPLVGIPMEREPIVQQFNGDPSFKFFPRKGLNRGG